MVAFPLACTLGTAVWAAIAEQESIRSSDDEYIRSMHQLYRFAAGNRKLTSLVVALPLL